MQIAGGGAGRLSMFSCGGGIMLVMVKDGGRKGILPVSLQHHATMMMHYVRSAKVLILQTIQRLHPMPRGCRIP